MSRGRRSRTVDRSAASAGFRPLTADLMPQSVLRRRGARRARRGAVLVLVTAAVVSLGLLAAPALSLVDATADRDAAVDEGEVLAAQRASYVELAELERERTRLRAIEEAAMARDVSWAALVTAVGEALEQAAPAEASAGSMWIDEVQASAITSELELTEGRDALGVVGIGTMTFSVHSAAMPDIGAWTVALDGVGGLADARIESSTLTAESQDAGYTTTVTATVTEAAQSCRWSAAVLEPTDDGTETCGA